MKIAVIGTGTVGQTIASKLTSIGHDVMIGTRDVKEKLNSTKGKPTFAEWHKANDKVKLGTFSEAAAFGEIIINATQGGSSVSALKLADSKNLKDKVLIDIGNPLDFSKGAPPSLLPELSNTHSLGEEIQKNFPDVKVVKTLNTMWCGLMMNPGMINGGGHTNFICGNDADAKQTVKSLLNQIGWKNENLLDLGDISCSRGTEAVLPIWLRVWNATQNGAFNFNIVS
jgi:predicted dinucleotide-binding enzyme